MDLLFKSNSEEKKKEIDPSIKIGKYILPLLVYIPITIFLIIIGSFFGVKIYKFIAQGGGIAKFFERSIYKIFSFKDNLNMFIQKYWPRGVFSKILAPEGWGRGGGAHFQKVPYLIVFNLKSQRTI